MISSIPDRFWDKISIGKNSCWEWTASKTDHGYGHFRDERTMVLAHRYIFSKIDPTFKKEMKVCHKCDNPSCVNPSHLFKGTQKDNMLDCSLKKRHRAYKMTECKNGHEFSGENVGISKVGKRFCRKCAVLATIKYRLKNKV